MSTEHVLPPVAVSVTVARPAAEAFDLFTAGIDRWWPRSAYSISEARTARCVLECFAGGAVYEVRDDGARFAWGQVLAFERPRRLLLSWHPGRPPEQAQEVEVRFHEEGEGTRVSLEHRGWERLGVEAAGVREGYQGGWQTVLGKHYVEALP
ncbi:MAG TPA: SRPBCC domain-containing protein [Vicinamibacteria bacterium]